MNFPCKSIFFCDVIHEGWSLKSLSKRFSSSKIFNNYNDREMVVDALSTKLGPNQLSNQIQTKQIESGYE